MNRLVAVPLCAVSLVLLGASVPQSHFTMEQILSAPYIGDLETSSDGRAVAYMVHELGAHGIYTARLGEPPHLTIAYGGDDGQDLGELALSRDGAAVAYVRGGSPNGDGEVPNPLSLPVPPEQAVWIVSTGGGTPHRLGTGSAPSIAPDDARVLWIDDGQPMIAALLWHGDALAGVGRARRLFTIRGRVNDVQFSPDGSRIVFENARGNHSFVVVYDFAAKRLTYLAPDFMHDIAPAWSPDGTAVAFVRTPGSRENEDPFRYLSESASEAPFELWVGDPSNGDAHEIWAADPGMGSVFYGLAEGNQLFWSSNGRIAFPWEKNGWRQLYSVPAAGGSATPLMSGAFEVESAAMSLNRTQIYYATNQGDIDRRHIWSVGFDGAAPLAMTGGADSQWFPTALAAGAIAYVNAGWSDVPQVTVRAASSQTTVLGPAVPAAFPKDQVVEPQLVTFLSSDGLTLHGQLFVPNDGRAKHCAIIFDHGGSLRQMLPGFHYMEAYANLYEENQYLANRGCVVLSINYRGGIMYGHDFRDAKNAGPDGGSEYLDVLAGAKYLQAQPFVDPNRLGIYGLSYGGYLTALGLARNSDIFKVGFDMAGVHNWRYLAGSGGTQQERQIAYDSSPVASLSTWRSPVFLAQGDDDRNVDFAEGVDLAQRLRAQGVEVRTMVFPNEIHEMTLTFADNVRLFTAGAQFLLAHLGGDTGP